MPSWLLLLATLLLCGCASTTQSGRMQLSVPAPLAAIYSEAGMRMQLAASQAVANECDGPQCALDPAFGARVRHLSAALADTAFAAHPALRERCERFEFVVVDNPEPGSASSAAGTVAIHSGVQQLRLDDAALAFLIAREMAHVIERHHDEDSATNILVSLLAQAAQWALPVPAVLRSIVAAMPVEVFAVAAATTTTAASVVGARAARSGKRPEQLREADDMALELLAQRGWYGREVAAALGGGLPALGKGEWSDDLRGSALRVAELTQGPPLLAPAFAAAPLLVRGDAAAGPTPATLTP